jgi:UrcA family protein
VRQHGKASLAAIQVLAAVLAVGVGLAVGAGLAAVAQPSRAGDPIFELTVVAPRLVREEVGRQPATASDVELVSLTRRVSYSDLDLALHAHVLELERRIEATAREACEQLARLFPRSDPKTPDCLAEAVAGARVQAEQAIRTAKPR